MMPMKIELYHQESTDWMWMFNILLFDFKSNESSRITRKYGHETLLNFACL